MRKKLIRLLWLCMVLSISRLSAQIYEIDSLIKDYVEAYDVLTTDDYIKKNDLGYEDTSSQIPNGTEVILKEVIHNKAYSLPNHLRYNAMIEYEGQTKYIYAWNLKFSDKNPEGTIDVLKDYDMSPNLITAKDKETKDVKLYNTLDFRSPEGKLLTSLAYPFSILGFILVTFILQVIAVKLSKKMFTFLVLVVSVFTLAIIVIMEGYYLIRLGPFSIWFCDVEYFTIGRAVLNSIPFVLAIFLQVFSIILFRKNLHLFLKKKLILLPSIILLIVSVVGIFALLFVIPTDIFGIPEGTSPETWEEFEVAVQKMFLGVAFALPVLAVLFYGIKYKFMGIFAGIFLTYYWLGTLTAIGFLVYALIRIFIAIMCQIFMYVGVYIYVMKISPTLHIHGDWVLPDGTVVGRQIAGAVWKDY